MISRKTCLEWADDADFSFVEQVSSAQIERLANRAYAEGQKDARKEEPICARCWVRRHYNCSETEDGPHQV